MPAAGLSTMTKHSHVQCVDLRLTNVRYHEDKKCKLFHLR